MSKPEIRIPKTDEEAAKSCKELLCSHYASGNSCDVLGAITVETRHQCYLRGYMVARFRQQFKFWRG